MKLMIITQPKAGTYLCSEIVKQFGLTQTYKHIAEDGYTQYNPNLLEQGRTDPNQFWIPQAISITVAEIKDNEFAVTHVPHHRVHETLFNDFKKIYISRPRKEIEESFRVWNQQTGRSKLQPRGQRLETRLANIHKWHNKDNVFKMTFDDMRLKRSGVIDQMQLYLFDEVKYNSIQVLETALAQPTLTKRR